MEKSPLQLNGEFLTIEEKENSSKNNFTFLFFVDFLNIFFLFGFP